MRGLKVRRAGPKDEIPWKLLLSADGPSHQVHKYLRRGELLLAEFGGKIVGEMVLMETRMDVWEIMNIAVLPKFRRKGVGTKLLQKARSIAKQRGAHRLEVGTDNGSFDRLSFYQRFGFRIVGVDLDFFVRRYNKVIKQDGILLRDMLRMVIEFKV